MPPFTRMTFCPLPPVIVVGVDTVPNVWAGASALASAAAERASTSAWSSRPDR